MTREFILHCDNPDVEDGIVIWDLDDCGIQIEVNGTNEINFRDVESFKKFYNQLGEFLREIE